MILVVAALILLPSEKAQAAVRDHIHTDTVDPDGVTINLFDYWVTAPDEDGQNINRDNAEGGINRGFLRFGGKGDSTGINGWNGGPIQQGIVNPLLGEDGYPVLAEGSGESLAYLFNPDDVTYGEYKRQYKNVTGLFRVNTETGNYYYDSRKNYAAFNEDKNAFEVYPDWGMKHSEENADRMDGYFFPFDGADKVFTETTDGKLEQTDLNCNNPRVNHFFGMTMTAEFIQPAQGLVTVPGEGTEGKPMVFSFSGDDDIWVFIDGVLVMDLGGIHNSAGGSIDFSTGKVTLENPNANPDGSTATSETTIKERYEAALGTGFNGDGFSRNTFADNSYHTLQVFYLERGAGASNLKIDFNIKSRPENSVYKMDQYGNGIGGVDFDLYDTNDKYEITADAKPIMSVTTGANGRVVFKDSDGKSFDFAQSDSSVEHYYVLRERGAPPGYRGAAEVHLKYTKSGQLLVDNKWESGAMSNFSVKVTQYGEFLDQGGNSVNVENGTVFAVVFGKNTEDGKWYPLTGTNAGGWTMSPGNTYADIINAARQNRNIFQEEAGLLTVTIDELPGDITEYWYANLSTGENAKYVAAYFYTTGSLDAEDAAANTQRLNVSDFTRDFSANIWVANVKNELTVRKVDKEGAALSGAEFSLYKGAYVTDGAVNAGAQAYDTTVTGEDGTAKFPFRKNVLENGTYYLKETGAPEGYIENSTLVKVIVNDEGVYADAGGTNDGVRVHAGVGYLLKPLEKFGANDDIDATLHDIYLLSQTGTGESDGTVVWGDPGEEALHLMYGKDGKLLQYGPYDEDTNPYLTTETGFIRASVYQCLGQGHGEGNKTDLGKNPITSLFTGSTVVEVENEIKTAVLDVTKTVDGDGAEGDAKAFRFTLTLTSGGIPYSEKSVAYSGAGTVVDGRPGTDGTKSVITDDGGQIQFTLRKTQELRFTGLPEGVSFTVEEQDYQTEGYSTKYVVTEGSVVGQETEGRTASGESSYDAPAKAAFTNTRHFRDFEFVKTDGKAGKPGVPLEGASFVLFRWTGTGAAGKAPINPDNPGNDWIKVEGSKITTGESGLVTFQDLIEGAAYRLIETAAPEGYITPAGQWNLTYVAEGENPGWLIEMAADGTKKPPAFTFTDNQYQLPNYGIQDIPSSGGRGTLLTGFVGTMLIGSAVLVFAAWARYRRRRF